MQKKMLVKNENNQRNLFETDFGFVDPQQKVIWAGRKFWSVKWFQIARNGKKIGPTLFFVHFPEYIGIQQIRFVKGDCFYSYNTFHGIVF